MQRTSPGHHCRSTALINTVVIGAVNVGSTVIAVLAVDRMGRKFLLVEGGIQCCICMVSGMGGWGGVVERGACPTSRFLLVEGGIQCCIGMVGGWVRWGGPGRAGPGQAMFTTGGSSLASLPPGLITRPTCTYLPACPALLQIIVGVVLGVEFSEVAGTILPQPVARGVLAVICEWMWSLCGGPAASVVENHSLSTHAEAPVISFIPSRVADKPARPTLCPMACSLTALPACRHLHRWVCLVGGLKSGRQQVSLCACAPVHVLLLHSPRNPAAAADADLSSSWHTPARLVLLPLLRAASPCGWPLLWLTAVGLAVQQPVGNLLTGVACSLEW